MNILWVVRQPLVDRLVWSTEGFLKLVIEVDVVKAKGRRADGLPDILECGGPAFRHAHIMLKMPR